MLKIKLEVSRCVSSARFAGSSGSHNVPFRDGRSLLAEYSTRRSYTCSYFTGLALSLTSHKIWLLLDIDSRPTSVCSYHLDLRKMYLASLLRIVPGGMQYSSRIVALHLQLNALFVWLGELENFEFLGEILSKTFPHRA